MSGFTHTINGKSVGSPKSFAVVNPATGQPFAQCPDGTLAQLDEAVAAAAKAFPGWAALPHDERKAYFRKAAEQITKHTEEIAKLLATEQGKPLAHATSEVNRTALWFTATCEFPIKWEELTKGPNGGTVKIVRRPVGVVAGICPWNYPVSMASWKMCPALITGNTIVVKPSPYTPLATLLLGTVLRDVFPPGVFNVIAGGDELGRAMTTHPGVRKVSFTGSTATGKKIREVTAKDLKLCTLELGGNDAAVLLPDVSVPEVAQRIFALAMANTGQVCAAIKRVYVHESQYEPFLAELAKAAAKAKFGDAFEKGVQYGPLNNKMQFDKVKSLVDDVREKGGRIVAGGAAIDRPGFFFQPTIVADVVEGRHRIVDEEQFGPVLPVLKYATVEEAVRRANNSPYGLGASVWGKDRASCDRVAEQLEAGSVWVNKHLDIQPDIPFGGYKESGQGREHGHWGLNEYLHVKVINISKL